MAKKLFDFVHAILSKQDTLVVPDFGAFVVQKTTTFLNDGDYISIIFTAQQQHDDGVLKSYIAEKTNMNDDEVEEFISSALEEVFIEINSKGIYQVEGIGDFRAVNDSIVFRAYEVQYIRDAEERRDAEAPQLRSGTGEPGVSESAEKRPLSLEEAAAEFLKDAEGEERRDAEEAKVAEVAEVAKIAEVVEKKEEPKKVEPKKVESKKVESVKAVSSFDIKKYSTGIIIFVLVAVLGGTLYLFRNEIANMNKPVVTNDTSQVVTQENMQQLADTLSEIDNSTVSNDQAIDTTTSTSPVVTDNSSTSGVVSVSEGNNTRANGVILKGNVATTTYYVTSGAYNSKQEASVEKKNLDVTGFEAKIIETSTGKKYHVVVAEFTDEASAKEELNFDKKIDNKFYLTTVKPNDK